jgi:hypothetical protein
MTYWLPSAINSRLDSCSFTTAQELLVGISTDLLWTAQGQPCVRPAYDDGVGGAESRRRLSRHLP